MMAENGQIMRGLCLIPAICEKLGTKGDPEVVSASGATSHSHSGILHDGDCIALRGEGQQAASVAQGGAGGEGDTASRGPMVVLCPSFDTPTRTRHSSDGSVFETFRCRVDAFPDRRNAVMGAPIMMRQMNEETKSRIIDLLQKLAPSRARVFTRSRGGKTAKEYQPVRVWP